MTAPATCRAPRPGPAGTCVLDRKRSQGTSMAMVSIALRTVTLDLAVAVAICVVQQDIEDLTDGRAGGRLPASSRATSVWIGRPCCARGRASAPGRRFRWAHERSRLASEQGIGDLNGPQVPRAAPRGFLVRLMPDISAHIPSRRRNPHCRSMNASTARMKEPARFMTR